jgi:cell wall-associated NlpC family hydrolase
VGFYVGDNKFISATSSNGIQVVSLDNSYWSKYYVGAKRVY